MTRSAFDAFRGAVCKRVRFTPDRAAIPAEPTAHPEDRYSIHQDFRCPPYGAAGKLLYQSPVPASWASYAMACLG